MGLKFTVRGKDQRHRVPRKTDTINSLFASGITRASTFFSTDLLHLFFFVIGRLEKL